MHSASASRYKTSSNQGVQARHAEAAGHRRCGRISFLPRPPPAEQSEPEPEPEPGPEPEPERSWSRSREPEPEPSRSPSWSSILAVEASAISILDPAKATTLQVSISAAQRDATVRAAQRSETDGQELGA